MVSFSLFYEVEVLQVFSRCFRFFSGIFLTEDLTPTSDSDPPPPTEAESPPPLNSSDKDISGSLDVQKQPQQLQQPYLIEDFIPTVFVEQVRYQNVGLVLVYSLFCIEMQNIAFLLSCL